MIQVMQLQEFLENCETLVGEDVDSPIEVQENQKTIFFAVSPEFFEFYKKVVNAVQNS